MSWRTLLVLGGTGSGRSEFAESLLAGRTDGASGAAGAGGADVRRIPAAGNGGDLTRLASTLAEAKPDESLLVEDLAGWLSGERNTAEPDPAALVEAVRACPAARVVLVSSETGLAPVPSAATSRNRTLAMGALNRALADTVDAAVLVVAGQPVWLKPAAPSTAVVTPAPAATASAGPPPDLSNLKDLPAPDDYARRAALAHLAAAGTAQLGALDTIVSFAAGTQGRDRPTPWRQVRVLVLHGDHAGAAGAGAAAGGSAHRVVQLHEGTSPLAQLATAAGAGDAGGVDVQVVEVAAAAPIEDGPAMPDDEAADAAMAYGWRLAEQAADDGVEAIVLGSIGDGADTAAAAAVSVLATNAEPASLLARVRTADGTIDDHAWIERCAAVRDAVHRVRSAGRTGARPVLADLGGPDIATAAGLLLGATARRTPVLLDGPVGVAAVLAARSLAASARYWCLLPDHNGHPTVVRVSEQLGMAPLLNLRMDLGEGTTSLAALPLLRTALTLATTLSVDNDAG